MRHFLRLLSLLAILLLMAPFYDHCNGQRLKYGRIETTEVVAVSPPQQPTQTDAPEVTAEETELGRKFREAYEFIDDSDSENVFEIANMASDYMNSPSKTLSEFSKAISKRDWTGLAFFFKVWCFVSICLITTMVFILSLTTREILLYHFTIANISILLLSFVLMFCDGLFESFSQIKWGYYAFAAVQILSLVLQRQKAGKISD